MNNDYDFLTACEDETLECPKCNAIWQTEVHYNYDLGGFYHEDDNCPNDCTSFLGFRIEGKIKNDKILPIKNKKIRYKRIPI